MNRLQKIIPAAGLIALAVTSLPTAARARAVPKAVEQYLVGVAKFSPAEAASLEAGQVIAKVAPGGVEGEVVAVAAVRIRAARKQVVAYYQYNPALRDYLSQYPRQTLPGATDILYWVNEQYTGLKPVLSLVHGVIYDAPGQPDRTVIMQKQLYASHYYDGSLALAIAIDADDGGAPATYLIYANRSRGDLLKGGFGGLKRRLAGDQARKAAVQTLETIKTVLEQPAR